MPVYLGIDTSNYTTSAALYCGDTGELLSEKKLLPVRQGELGLRQSDAVFHHVRQLPEVLGALFGQTDRTPCAVGYSARPRDEQVSYMPCFLSGECAAKAVAAASGLPVYAFSHQAGHIAAALFSVGRLDLLSKRFLAFHVSGGTTECLLVEPSPETVFSIRRIGQSLDLKAGQAVDRVGALLGLRFPSGPELDRLSRQCVQAYEVKPVLKGLDCCLSGVQNQCERMHKNGALPCEVARYCIDYLLHTLAAMTQAALDTFGSLPLLYAGGVMSNTLIRESLSARFGGLFAAPSLSSDNAAGTALLTCVRTTGGV